MNCRRSTLRSSFLFLAAFFLPLLAALSARAEPPIRIVFQDDEVGKAPHGWMCRLKDPGKSYFVQEEAGKKYLRADVFDAPAEAFGYEKAWPLGAYPMLQWRWRAVQFPTNSDERLKSGSDSAVGVFVVFGHWPFLKCLKYIWSDVVPAGTSFVSPHSSRTSIIVLQSGRNLAGTWVSEKRDVLADYRRFFNPRETPTARGIAVLTDADSTHSHAVGDYADFETLPAP